MYIYIYVAAGKSLNMLGQQYSFSHFAGRTNKENVVIEILSLIAFHTFLEPHFQPFIHRCLVMPNHFLCKDWVKIIQLIANHLFQCLAGLGVPGCNLRLDSQTTIMGKMVGKPLGWGPLNNQPHIHLI